MVNVSENCYKFSISIQPCAWRWSSITLLKNVTGRAILTAA